MILGMADKMNDKHCTVPHACPCFKDYLTSLKESVDELSTDDLFYAGYDWISFSVGVSETKTAIGNLIMLDLKEVE